MYIIFRDSFGTEVLYEVIAVIEYKGRVTASGHSDGHYICDVKDELTENGSEQMTIIFL